MTAAVLSAPLLALLIRCIKSYFAVNQTSLLPDDSFSSVERDALHG